MTRAASNATGPSAKGAIVVGTSSTAASSVTVGTDGQVLTADSTQTAGVKWASTSASQTWSLLNTTSLATGTTYTVSGLSAANLAVFFATSANIGASKSVTITVNSDTGTNYSRYGVVWTGNPQYPQLLGGTGYTSFSLGTTSPNNGGASGSVVMTNCNSTSYKQAWVSGVGGNDGISTAYVYNGLYVGSAAITSVTITTTGTWAGGTMYVYGGA